MEGRATAACRTGAGAGAVRCGGGKRAQTSCVRTVNGASAGGIRTSRSKTASSKICSPAAAASPSGRLKTKKNRPGKRLRRFFLKFWLRGQDLNL